MVIFLSVVFQRSPALFVESSVGHGQGRGGRNRSGGSTLSEVERVPRRLARSVPHFAFDDEVTVKVVTFSVDCNGIKLPASLWFLHYHEIMRRLIH